MKILAQVLSVYGHIAQSYKPTCGLGLLGEPKIKPKLPETLTVKINHCGPGPFVNKQPEFFAANGLLPFPS